MLVDILNMKKMTVENRSNDEIERFYFLLQAAAQNEGVRVNCICPVFVEGTDMFNESISDSPMLRSITEKVGPIT